MLVTLKQAYEAIRPSRKSDLPLGKRRLEEHTNAVEKLKVEDESLGNRETTVKRRKESEYFSSKIRTLLAMLIGLAGCGKDAKTTFHRQLQNDNCSSFLEPEAYHNGLRPNTNISNPSAWRK